MTCNPCDMKERWILNSRILYECVHHDVISHIDDYEILPTIVKPLDWRKEDDYVFGHIPGRNGYVRAKNSDDRIIVTFTKDSQETKMNDRKLEELLKQSQDLVTRQKELGEEIQRLRDLEDGKYLWKPKFNGFYFLPSLGGRVKKCRFDSRQDESYWEKGICFETEEGAADHTKWQHVNNLLRTYAKLFNAPRTELLTLHNLLYRVEVDFCGEIIYPYSINMSGGSEFLFKEDAERAVGLIGAESIIEAFSL